MFEILRMKEINNCIKALVECLICDQASEFHEEEWRDVLEGVLNAVAFELLSDGVIPYIPLEEDLA